MNTSFHANNLYISLNHKIPQSCPNQLTWKKINFWHSSTNDISLSYLPRLKFQAFYKAPCRIQLANFCRVKNTSKRWSKLERFGLCCECNRTFQPSSYRILPWHYIFFNVRSFSSYLLMKINNYLTNWLKFYSCR